MPEMNRREMVQLLAGGMAAFGLTPPAIERAWRAVRGTQHAARLFFTDHEWETVRLLVDYIIPRDDRSGSATDAQVPEFMDFILSESEDSQVPIRGGLAWLDNECWERFGKSFVELDDPSRRQVLDDIAWPARARPELVHGVEFFSRFRDFTASGFWSSKMGVEDLRYIGNTFVMEWKGCPAEALKHIGVG